MNILVTGGRGYIGSHVILELVARGHYVVSVDINPFFESSHAVQYYQGDFADQNLLNRIFSERKIDAVIHLAASIDAFESITKPEEYFLNNTTKTLVLAQALKEQDIRNLVFASSAAVYGPQQVFPVKETAPLHPVNPYGESKLQAEQQLAQLAKKSGLRVTALRFFNVVGSKFGSGIRSKNQTSLFAQLLKAIQTGSEFIINGVDLGTPDGTAVRDFIHVQDIARACVLATENNPGQSSSFEAYNVGSGQGYSIKQLINEFEQVTGKKIAVKVFPKKDGDIPISISSIVKINQSYAFKPQYSDLPTLVKSSL